MSETSKGFVLAPSSLTDALFESVRLRIINGDIAPGEKVTESRIATDYSVARTTAKACLERLTSVGLLTRTIHRTAVVPQFNEAEIRDLFFAREAVEASAVGALADRATVPSSAYEAQYAIEAAANLKSFDRQVEADVRFHSSLVEAAGSSRLNRMHEMIMGEVHLTMGQFQAHQSIAPETIAAEHADILAAIGAGDRVRALDRLGHHLGGARERLVARSATTSLVAPGAESEAEPSPA